MGASQAGLEAVCYLRILERRDGMKHGYGLSLQGFACRGRVAGGSYLISKDKHVVPEPAALGLLALGGLALLRRRKK